MLPKLGTDTAQKSNQTLFPKMTDNWQELSVPGNNTSYDKYYLNLFGFIYGTFPSAPGALPFAQQYGKCIESDVSLYTFCRCKLESEIVCCYEVIFERISFIFCYNNCVILPLIFSFRVMNTLCISSL